MHDTLPFGLRPGRRASIFDAASHSRLGTFVPSPRPRCNSLGTAVAVASSRPWAQSSLYVSANRGAGASAGASHALERVAFGDRVRASLLCVFLLLDYGGGGTEYRSFAGSRIAQSLCPHAMHRRCDRFAGGDLQCPSESLGFGRSDEPVRPFYASSEILRKQHTGAFRRGPGGGSAMDLEV